VLEALVRTGSDHRDVPFLALAAPGALAGLATLAATRRSTDPGRAALALGAPLLALWLCSAAVYDAAVLHAGLLDAFHPWSFSGSAGSATVLALAVTGVAVARGIWIGASEPGLSAVVFSVATGAVAFLVVFSVAALHGHDAFAHAIAHDAATLLLVAFPGAIATLALVHERDLERESLRRPPATPSTGWLLAIGAPMAAVGGLAVVVVFVLAPVAPVVGRLVGDVGRGIAALLTAIARLFGHLSIRGHSSAPRGIGPALAKLPPLDLRPAHVPGWLVVVGVLLGVLLGVGACVVLVRLWRHRPRRPGVRGRRATASPDEQRDSVFSFGHVLDQIRAALARIAARSRDAAALDAREDTDSEDTEPLSVRREYRRLLRAARLAGQARRRGETPLELASRLVADGGGELSPAASLQRLTDLYDDIRYGDAPEHARDSAAASELVDVVVSVLVGSQDDDATPIEANPPRSTS
jgi:hypothetical protein